MEKDQTSTVSKAKNTANSKSEFIKSLPVELPVREVIRRARDVGFEVSKAYVHEIRASMRKTQVQDSSQQPAVLPEAKVQATFSFVSGEQPAPAVLPAQGTAGASAQSKREYIMSIPLDIPVRQVLEDAAKAGFPVSKAYVHEVRSKLKIQPKVEAKAKESRAKVTKDEPSKNTDAKREVAFRRLVIELGTSRARTLLEQVERKLNALILDE